MNIALVGYGKMGKEIEKVLIERSHRVALIIDYNNAHDLCAANLKDIDVAIEFSTPDAAFGNICRLIETGVPTVCGTTAWLDKIEHVKDLTVKHDGAFFYASNYSVGVNMFFHANAELARLMNRFEQYDVTLEETHHTQKKDAPSGTAITAAEGIIANIDRKTEWLCGTTTDPEKLEIAAIRRSIVPGTHTVTWECEADTITLTHTAKSRRGFALGAVLAAEFIAGRKGVFSMNDLLGF